MSQELLPLKTLFNFSFSSYSFLVGLSETHASRLSLLRASKTNNMRFDFHFASAWFRFDVPTPRQGVKIYYSSPVVDKSKLVLFMMLVSAYRLAISKHNPHAKPLGLGKYACYLTSCRVQKRPFSLISTAEERANFSSVQGRFFFCKCVTYTFCRVLLGISALLELILSIFFFFFLFLQRGNLEVFLKEPNLIKERKNKLQNQHCRNWQIEISIKR